MVSNWYVITIDALQQLLEQFIIFLPRILGAIIVFIIGWLISVGIGRLIAGILKRLKLNEAFEKTGCQKALERAEIKTTISDFIGAIIKWILVIVFIMAAIEILKIPQFSLFLSKIVIWFPNLVAAIAIFVVAVIIAEYIEKIVRAITERLGVGYSKLSGVIAKWAIWIFAIFAILIQLGIGKDLVKILTNGIIALIVISCGIAFGLGGKDLAQETLRELKEKFKK